MGCGTATDKRELVRIVRTKDGDVAVDPSGKSAGRGAYVCPRSECFEAAVGKGRLGTALRSRLGEDDVDRLRRDHETVLAAQDRSRQGR